MAKSRFSNSGRGPNGPSQRQLRVGELLRRSLADVLSRGEVHDPELAQYIVTVAEVRTSPDLRHATAFVSPLGGVGAKEMLKLLRQNRKTLRHILAGQVSLKYAPELHFELDHAFDQMDETRRMLADERVQRDIQTVSDVEEDED